MKEEVNRYSRRFHLTERETEVLQLLVTRVVSPAQLGKEMSISLHTVNNHLKKIMEKTKCDSKTALLADFLVFLDQNRAETGIRTPLVLLVDDEPELTKLLQDYLEQENIRCLTSNDPIEALEMVKKYRIDVVITDIRMPKANGLSLVREMRQHHLFEPGVIFISGFIEEYGVDSLFDLGAFSIMEKPVDLKRLKLLIWQHYVGNSQSGDATFQALEENASKDMPAPEVTLGYGGVFVSCRNSWPEIAVVGKKFELEFRVPGSSSSHKGICEIAWTRTESPPGFGARFLSLPPEARKEVWEYVRKNNVYSFIPKGV